MKEDRSFLCFPGNETSEETIQRKASDYSKASIAAGSVFILLFYLFI
jgi:hypothetical protein